MTQICPNYLVWAQRICNQTPRNGLPWVDIQIKTYKKFCQERLEKMWLYTLQVVLIALAQNFLGVICTSSIVLAISIRIQFLRSTIPFYWGTYGEENWCSRSKEAHNVSKWVFYVIINMNFSYDIFWKLILQSKNKSQAWEEASSFASMKNTQE